VDTNDNSKFWALIQLINHVVVFMKILIVSILSKKRNKRNYQNLDFIYFIYLFYYCSRFESRLLFL